MFRAVATIPLRMSQAQRRLVAKLVPALAPLMAVEEKHARSIPLDLQQLRAILSASESARNLTPGERKSLRIVAQLAAQGIPQVRSIDRIPASERLYQLRIALRDVQPTIWRRIQIRDCTLARLHDSIQAAMGWLNMHMYLYEIDGVTYSDPEQLDEADTDGEDATVVRLDEIVPRDGRRFHFDYCYDLGDCWEHDVLFEGCLRADDRVRYPLCLEGERACPPEDVGGPWGYNTLLKALADGRHERHDEFRDWVGTDFDPDFFSADETTESLRRGMPSWNE